MDRGDIYLVSLDPTSGHEQKGMRPVLVISQASFNRVTRAPMILPITNGGSLARTGGFAVSLVGAGTDTLGAIRCDQLRVLDIASRKGKKVEKAPAFIVDEVLSKLEAILGY